MIAVRYLVVMLICSLAAGMVPARAENALLDRWYWAMFKIDRALIKELLSEDATIELQDLGITQTRTEFIAALDEWEDIAQTTNFAWQIDSEATQSANQATALVCYQFVDNDLMVREVFTFGDGKITGSVQSAVGDTCDDF